MSAEQENGFSQIPQAELNLLRGVDRRIYRAMTVLGTVGTLLCSLLGGLDWGAGFLIGAALSALNFHWMKTAVDVIAQAMSTGSASRGAAGAMARFLFRYALIGLAGYAIFKNSAISLRAFFLGLFLFLAAILAESVYEIYLGFRKQ